MNKRLLLMFFLSFFCSAIIVQHTIHTKNKGPKKKRRATSRGKRSRRTSSRKKRKGPSGGGGGSSPILNTNKQKEQQSSPQVDPQTGQPSNQQTDSQTTESGSNQNKKPISEAEKFAAAIIDEKKPTQQTLAQDHNLLRNIKIQKQPTSNITTEVQDKTASQETKQASENTAKDEQSNIKKDTSQEKDLEKQSEGVDDQKKSKDSDPIEMSIENIQKHFIHIGNERFCKFINNETIKIDKDIETQNRKALLIIKEGIDKKHPIFAQFFTCKALYNEQEKIKAIISKPLLKDSKSISSLIDTLEKLLNEKIENLITSVQVQQSTSANENIITDEENISYYKSLDHIKDLICDEYIKEANENKQSLLDTINFLGNNLLLLSSIKLNSLASEYENAQLIYLHEKLNEKISDYILKIKPLRYRFRTDIQSLADEKISKPAFMNIDDTKAPLAIGVPKKINSLIRTEYIKKYIGEAFQAITSYLIVNEEESKNAILAYITGISDLSDPTNDKGEYRKKTKLYLSNIENKEPEHTSLRELLLKQKPSLKDETTLFNQRFYDELIDFLTRLRSNAQDFFKTITPESMSNIIDPSNNNLKTIDQYLSFINPHEDQATLRGYIFSQIVSSLISKLITRIIDTMIEEEKGTGGEVSKKYIDLFENDSLAKLLEYLKEDYSSLISEFFDKIVSSAKTYNEIISDTFFYNPDALKLVPDIEKAYNQIEKVQNGLLSFSLPSELINIDEKYSFYFSEISSKKDKTGFFTNIKNFFNKEKSASELEEEMSTMFTRIFNKVSLVEKLINPQPDNKQDENIENKYFLPTVQKTLSSLMIFINSILKTEHKTSDSDFYKKLKTITEVSSRYNTNISNWLYLLPKNSSHNFFGMMQLYNIIKMMNNLKTLSKDNVSIYRVKYSKAVSDLQQKKEADIPVKDISLEFISEKEGLSKKATQPVNQEKQIKVSTHVTEPKEKIEPFKLSIQTGSLNVPII